MPLFDRITTYSAYVSQNNYLSFSRSLRLALESGGTAFIGFPPVRPANWLTQSPGFTTVYMPLEEYNDVYHVLQTEKPVFFTALQFLGLDVAAVHTELDLSLGEPTGEGYDDQSLEALIVRARNEPDALVGGSSVAAAG